MSNNEIWTQQVRKRSIALLYGIIVKATKQGKTVSKKKIRAVFSIDYGVKGLTFDTYLSELLDADRITIIDDEIMAKEVDNGSTNP